MDDTPDKENPPKDFNKLDLSQLQGFSFGTQWTQDKSPSGERREQGDRPRRDSGPDRREGPGSAPDRRDRRAFRKPADEVGAASARPPGEGVAGDRRPQMGDRGPRREFQGGPRRDGPGGGAERGGPRYGGRGEQQPEQRGPYESPFFAVSFYPEDTSFNALAKTIRSSCRTIELFEIARTVVAKLDRFVVVLTRKPAFADPAAPASAAPDQRLIYLSVPDGLPFDTEEASIAHVLGKYLGNFFDLADVEVEPPKGNFQVINRCTVTGELLGPPNYHRYTQIVQQHFAAKISRMSLEAYRGRIETVRDPEVVAQWLAKMKKTTRYTWKLTSPAPAKPPAPAPEPAAEPAVAVEGVPAPEAAPAEVPPAPVAPSFDNFEDARAYLFAEARDKVVRPVETARFHGKIAEDLPPGEIRAAIEGALERQRRFPLDTANALRGRLRREHFTIFKKGSKGVSYVCAVKRKFRVPGQTFAESIAELISFIESHPMVRASALPEKFLGLKLPTAPKAAEPAVAPVEGQPVSEAVPTAPELVLTIEQRAKFARMQGDLRWLVTEGYVTEFIDGRLFAPPPMVEARKREVEAEDNDPENFPEVPADSRPPMAFSTSVAAPAPEVVEPSAEPAPETVPVAEAAPVVVELVAAPAAEPAPVIEPVATIAAEPAPAAPADETQKS